MAVPARLRETVSTFLYRNGNILTITTVAAIVVVGISVVNDPHRWWTSLVAVAIIALLVLLLANAKVVVKAALSLVLLLLEAGWAFQVGTALDHSGGVGILWLMSTLTLYTLCLTLSYLLPTLVSRWTRSLLITTLGLLLTTGLLFAGVPALPTLALSFIVSVLCYLFLLRFGVHSFYKRKNFPTFTYPREKLETMQEGLLQAGWGASIINHRGNHALLVWDDSHGFVLGPLTLTQKFGAVGRRHVQLSYQGHKLSPWLIDSYRKLVPFWRTKGAPLLLVLLDVNNRNGRQGELIGLTLPDSKRKLPVAIYPSSGFIAKQAWGSLMKELVATYGEVLPPLTPRQVKALDYTLPEDTLPQEEGKDNEKKHAPASAKEEATEA